MHEADVLIAPMGAAAKCTGKAGAPVLAIPAGIQQDGTPFGVTIFSNPGSDSTLIAIGAEIERSLQGRRLPSIR
jgi:amidase